LLFKMGTHRAQKTERLLVWFFCVCLLTSCGYRMIGSTTLPFKSVTIMPVVNKTYEPRLEERLHRSLAREFINQGIEVKPEGGDLIIESVIRSFRLGAIGAINEIVKEQEIFMNVDFTIRDHEREIKFKSIKSPIRITFNAAGTVSESVIEKERATEKACREIAKEIVGRILLVYAR